MKRSSVDLEWRFDEEEGQSRERRRGGWPFTSVMPFAALIAFIILLLGAWLVARHEIDRQAEERRTSVQEVLDLERQALLKGDGDLFLAAHSDEPAWLSAHLQPENIIPYRAGLTVTKVRRQGDEMWANVSWTDGDESWQRLAFFRWQAGRLLHVLASESYWGPVDHLTYPWGELRFHRIDRSLAEDVASYVEQVVGRLCRPVGTPECLPGRLPVTVQLASDFSQTAAANQIRLPSPRLLAIDGSAKPGQPFWSKLEQALESYLGPATIHFAVPDDLIPSYRKAAAEFMAVEPTIRVELISLDELPANPAEWPASVDGAALKPNAEMLAAGLVRDLTDFAETDPAFDRADFYGQIWQGAQWRGRMWFMPQAASINLVYTERKAYELAELAEPSLRWTWDEMAADLARLASTWPSDERQWIYLDPGLDSLYAYAFNWNNPCPQNGTVVCLAPVGSDSIAATLEWYRSMVVESGYMPDLTELEEEERSFRALNLVSPRRVAIWVDGPVHYELHLLSRRIGVTPFPGSERFDGVTPLWVQGSFISQSSRHPLATWQWLKHLSYQYLARQKRTIPARPSVARATQFWSILPRPLSEAMRAAFPLARPVMIDEQSLFRWEQLAGVVSGRQSPQEAALAHPRLRWFGINTATGEGQGSPP